MAGQALSGAASGAAAGSALGPWGTAIGAGVGLLGGIMADKASKKASRARAAALEKQALLRIKQGQLQADTIRGQGGMDQTTFATRALSSGSTDRTSLAQSGALTEIANRAEYEAGIAIENAALDAQSLRDDQAAMRRDEKDQTNAAYFNAATSILGTYGSYANTQNAADLQTAKNLGSSPNNYRRPF